jgi:predicted dehydrogenase
MGDGGSSPAGQEFKEFQADAEQKYGTKFAKSLSELPPPDQPRLALISGRTADNPKLLTESIAHGAKCVYLEKPGAPTVAELQQMKQEAEAAGVEVLMGYNKNVCKYVAKTREYASEHGGHVTFVSNNAYENTPESLGECFERNAEGMLKNMAIHELALLVSFYDVSVENIAEVHADKEFSSMQTLPGPSGKMFTDFDKIKFTIKTKSGNEVSVAADRCGGTDSFATVSDASGKEVFRYYMPDEEDKKHVEALQAKYPTAMPYFFTQDPDYITVKERVAKHTVDGAPAEGIATISTAVETLRVAEYLTPILQEQLK